VIVTVQRLASWSVASSYIAAVSAAQSGVRYHCNPARLLVKYIDLLFATGFSPGA
jgi:hypothetical protein